MQKFPVLVFRESPESYADKSLLLIVFQKTSRMALSLRLCQIFRKVPCNYAGAAQTQGPLQYWLGEETYGLKPCRC